MREKQTTDVERFATAAAEREPRLSGLANPRRRELATPAKALVTLWRRNPKALPTWRIRAAFADHLTMRYRSTPYENHDAGDLLGDWFDFQHSLVAPAYCLHFTCDGKVAAAITRARVGLGLPPPIKVRNHPGGEAGFVAELMATFPT